MIDNNTRKKLCKAESKMFDALIAIANECNLSDIELAYSVNRIAFHWTQLELTQRVGDAKCTQEC